MRFLSPSHHKPLPPYWPALHITPARVCLRSPSPGLCWDVSSVLKIALPVNGHAVLGPHKPHGRLGSHLHGPAPTWVQEERGQGAELPDDQWFLEMAEKDSVPSSPSQAPERGKLNATESWNWNR